MPTPSPSSGRRVLRAVLVALVVAATGLVAVGTLAYCSVFGCTVFSEDFEPEGEKATAARAAATASVSQLAGRVVAGREVLADARADGCRIGQNNWKVKDTYSHECAVTESRVVLLAAEPRDVAAGLTAADAAVRDAGCRPVTDRGGLDRVRDEYWTAGNPQVARYGAAGLPGATYTCPGGVSVLAQPTSATPGSSDPSVALDGTSPDVELSSDWYTADDLRALRESGAHLAVVYSVRDTYYRTRF